MRLILEHHWLTFIIVGSIGVAFLWVGLRDSLLTRVKIGIATIILAVLLFIVGLFVVTPTEHSKKIVSGFVNAVVDEQIGKALSFLSKDVVFIDDWRGESLSGIDGARKSLDALYSKHKLTFNTFLKVDFYERENDVLVEMSLFTRVSGIGSVPSKWRILVVEQDGGKWAIQSIDAIEIAGRSYR
ncbi:MAG: hypothetical protein H8E86_03035 [Planctomycetes bacterium]|nr:hypothetical protein [Planctomycetota bacterium]